MAKTGVGLQPANKGFLSIHLNEDCLITLKPDGTVEFHENYTPDKAAKVFWDAIAKNYHRVWGRAWLIVKALSELPEKHPMAQYDIATVSLIMEAKRVAGDMPVTDSKVEGAG